VQAPAPGAAAPSSKAPASTHFPATQALLFKDFKADLLLNKLLEINDDIRKIELEATGGVVALREGDSHQVKE
jgi:hypothetical protein